MPYQGAPWAGRLFPNQDNSQALSGFLSDDQMSRGPDQGRVAWLARPPLSLESRVCVRALSSDTLHTLLRSSIRLVFIIIEYNSYLRYLNISECWIEVPVWRLYHRWKMI